MRRLLVVEDGDEYGEFARAFFAADFEIVVAHSASEALAAARDRPVSAMLVDLRFDRIPIDALIGDVEQTAARLFGGDLARAVRHLQDQQGALILGQLRQSGCSARAVFVNDFPARRLANLQALYGDVFAVASFDVARLRAALDGAP